MSILIKDKQLTYLFLCNFSILFIGFGLFPVLPLYAAEFGASQSFIGIYLAITYAAISTGSILAAGLSERLPRKTLFAAAGLIGIPALFLLGQAHSLWQVVLLTALLWFTGGIGLSISNVLIGLHTTSTTRGQAFGALALASPLGVLIGGIVVSRTMEWGSYSLMFSVAAIVWSVWPVLALTRIQDKADCAPPIGLPVQAIDPSYRPGKTFLFLLLTILLSSMTVNIGRMGISLAMREHQLTASDVSTANAIGGLVTIPVTLLIGRFSDTLGRKRFLALGYLLAVAGTVMLMSAQELWQFWVVCALVLAARSVITSMSPAYATDLLRRKFLGRALPLVGTMNWVSGVVGFAGAGYILETFGGTSLYGATAMAAFIAASILALLPSSWREQHPSLIVYRQGSAPTTGD